MCAHQAFRGQVDFEVGTKLSLGWVVLKTQPRRELLAAEAVRSRGAESFVLYMPCRPGNQRPALLFPGYVFARVTAFDDLLRIRSAPGVAYVLPAAAPPALLPNAVVELLRARGLDPLAAPQLHHGDRVVIESGPFRWVEAVFDRRLNAAGRVRVLLTLVHRTVRLEVEDALLKRVRVP